MLPVNSNPTSAMAFKGKPSSKDIKKFIKIADTLGGDKLATRRLVKYEGITTEHMNHRLNLLMTNKIINIGQNIEQKFKSIGQWFKKLF